MNKALVEKLAVQSLVWVDTGLADGREQVFSTSVFAELIVEECAGLVDHVRMEDGTTRGEFIRKHFGVAE
jgi:hypothetical protein